MTKKSKNWKTESGLRDEMKIRKLILETQNHDRKKCRCEGCYWWSITRVVTKGGRLFEVIPSWKDLDRDEYLRIIYSTLRFKMDKKVSKEKLINYILSKGAPKEQAEQIAEQMLKPLHMIMYGKAASPLGILRDM